MRVLLIGGSGFVGGALCQALTGHDLTLFTRGAGDGTAPVLRGVRKDLPNLRGRFEADPPEVVIDTGASHGPAADLAIQAFQDLPVHIVMLSSLSVYRRYGAFLGIEPSGGDSGTAPLDEDAPLRKTLYVYRTAEGGSSDPSRPWLADYDKIPAERAYARMPGARVTILRLPLVYGPSDPDRRVQDLAARMRSGPIPLTPAMAAWRHARGAVENVAGAIAAAALLQTPPNGVRAFNVSDGGADLSEAAWLEAIGRAAGIARPYRIIETAPVAPLVSDFPDTAHYRYHLTLSTERLSRDLGWVPLISTQDALAQTLHGGGSTCH